MGLQGKEETQHKGKLELEGKWAEKIAVVRIRSFLRLK